MTRSLFARFATSLFLFATLCSTLAPAVTRAADLHDAPSADDIPMAARTANGMPSSGLRSFGFIPSTTHHSSAPAGTMQPMSMPSSVDLTQFAPPVGDQGSVNSCASWATAYYLRGWYAKRDGYYPAGGSGNTGSFAPMYLYSQIVHNFDSGHDTGSTLGENLDIQRNQGIDSRAHYTQGDSNFTSLPTSAETANAFTVKIDGYDDAAGPGEGGFGLQGYIQGKLAGGNPVVVAIPVYPEFYNASSTSYVVTSPQPGEHFYGNHAVAAFKYDATGVWVENQWGTGFGHNGWAVLTWDFINRFSLEAASIVPLSPLERFYNGTTQTHWVTRNANAVASSYHYESTLGKLYTTQVFGTVPLYGCENNVDTNDHFVSLDSHCEGRIFLGTDGYLYNVLPILVGQINPTVQVYRCLRMVSGHGDHFVSTDPHCEGYTTEMSLGYLRS